jgi:hypothetical protein
VGRCREPGLLFCPANLGKSGLISRSDTGEDVRERAAAGTDESEAQWTPCNLRGSSTGGGTAAGSGGTTGRRIPSNSFPLREERMPIIAADDMPGCTRPPALANFSMANSEMNCERGRGENVMSGARDAGGVAGTFLGRSGGQGGLEGARAGRTGRAGAKCVHSAARLLYGGRAAPLAVPLHRLVRTWSRAVGMCRSACVDLSEYGLCPSVKDSHVTPKVWMEVAWFTAMQTALSAEASALSRPSGRPMASSEPRTTLGEGAAGGAVRESVGSEPRDTGRGGEMRRRVMRALGAGSGRGSLRAQPCVRA